VKAFFSVFSLTYLFIYFWFNIEFSFVTFNLFISILELTFIFNVVFPFTSNKMIVIKSFKIT